MMDFSERSEYVGANVKPEIKQTLLEHLEFRKQNGNKISMSRWIEEAIIMRLERDAVPIVTQESRYVGEDLPFEEAS